jgi:alkylhydroperoxidase family enzyme
MSSLRLWQDPELLTIMDRARSYGTPRPESQVIRLHNPEVMKAFNHAWEVFFRQGVTDHSIKELCRLYISKSVQCEYCGGQRSVLARQQGATEDQVDEILDFERSERFDDRERPRWNGRWRSRGIRPSPLTICGTGCTSTSPSPNSSSSVTSSH